MKNYYLIFILILFCLTAHLSQAQRQESAALNEFTTIIAEEVGSDISARIVSSHVSKTSGVQHVYFEQLHKGIGIFNSVGSIHFGSNGKVIQHHSSFKANTKDLVNTETPLISATDALESAARQLGYTIVGEIREIKTEADMERTSILNNPSLNTHDIVVKLIYQELESRELRLCWSLNLMDMNSPDWWDIRVDAETGVILDKNNWTISCGQGDHKHETKPAKIVSGTPSCHHENRNETNSSSLGGYNVYAMPLKSPADGNRTIEVDPYDLIASPLGWHDTTSGSGPIITITQGNNVHAYEDGDNPGYNPDGGAGLMFDFPVDTIYSAGTQSEDAVITNLFYWNNIIHDLMYRYGFDEASGNFQENNYSNGGVGSDYVNAEAQDASGTCNANFSTPVDGMNPRMQMYVCNSRDGDLDNLVIVHEYGHGISIRLTGGPAFSNCLTGSEQMGEGWSDYFGLMMTMKDTDQSDDPIGIGTWLFGEPLNGPGIRPYPFSTDLNINPHTYDDINTEVAPHGVGSVWCAMLWEMTWALIDQYGFDPDLATGSGGNNIAMNLVIEALKLQPCNPGFVDGRDAILLADEMLYGGVNKCLIWEAFAKRGLGFSADQGTSGSKTDGTEAFDLPYDLQLIKLSDKQMAETGDTITYSLVVTNESICGSFTLYNLNISDTISDSRVTYLSGSATNGGSYNNGVVTFPTLATLSNGDSIARSFSVVVSDSFTFGQEYFFDDIENGSANWSTSSTSNSQWVINNVNAYSDSSSWFAEDNSSTVDKYLELNQTITPDSNSKLIFWHAFNTETNWDGGVVQYSVDNGTNWSDLGDYFIVNGYNSTIDNNVNTPAFSGNSQGYIQSIADLSSFTGTPMKIRFWMSCDAFVGGEGWYIDDVQIESDLIFNQATFRADSGFYDVVSVSGGPTLVYHPPCYNGVQDGDEEGIDCGGTYCRPCPTCDDGILNGNETDIDCGGPDCPECPVCVEVTMDIVVDNYPSETTWEIVDSFDNVIYSGGPYGGVSSGTLIRDSFCLNEGCYTLYFRDSYGDGICCAYGVGWYSMYRSTDSLVYASGGDFDFVDSTAFCSEEIMSSCDSLLMVHGLITSGTYQAGEVLASDGTIQSPSVVIFKAENEISLEPNFEVELGAELTTTIENCINALSAPNDAHMKHHPDQKVTPSQKD